MNHFSVLPKSIPAFCRYLSTRDDDDVDDDACKWLIKLNIIQSHSPVFFSSISFSRRFIVKLTAKPNILIILQIIKFIFCTLL